MCFTSRMIIYPLARARNGIRIVPRINSLPTRRTKSRIRAFNAARPFASLIYQYCDRLIARTGYSRLKNLRRTLPVYRITPIITSVHYSSASRASPRRLLNAPCRECINIVCKRINQRVYPKTWAPLIRRDTVLAFLLFSLGESMKLVRRVMRLSALRSWRIVDSAIFSYFRYFCPISAIFPQNVDVQKRKSELFNLYLIY